VSLWYINCNKKQKGKTMFIDVRTMRAVVSRSEREMAATDISKIVATFDAFNDGTPEDVKSYCAAVTTANIAKQDYILTPGRYVGIEEKEDDGGLFYEKMARLTDEISALWRIRERNTAEIGYVIE
jgi:type I restriction enzyme M protein